MLAYARTVDLGGSGAWQPHYRQCIIPSNTGGRTSLLKELHGFTINNETQMAFYTFWLTVRGSSCFCFFSYFTPLSFFFYPFFFFFFLANFNLVEIKATLENPVNGKWLNEHFSRNKKSVWTFLISFAFVALPRNKGRCRVSLRGWRQTTAVLTHFPTCFFFCDLPGNVFQQNKTGSIRKLAVFSYWAEKLLFVQMIQICSFHIGLRGGT